MANRLSASQQSRGGYDWYPRPVSDDVNVVVASSGGGMR